MPPFGIRNIPPGTDVCRSPSAPPLSACIPVRLIGVVSRPEMLLNLSRQHGLMLVRALAPAIQSAEISRRLNFHAFVTREPLFIFEEIVTSLSGVVNGA